MTEDQIRELFREMRDEPVPPDSKARVRMALAERTQSWPEKLRRRWKWMAALAPVCLLLVALFTWQKKVDMPPPPAAPAPSVAVVEAPAPIVAPPRPPIVHARHRAARPPRQVASNGASLIRIETPDPDVVILLIGG
jgi:hypothetical protein